MKNQRILGLDLLRICTALAILSYHYFFIGPLQGFYDMAVFHGLAFWGEFGVDIFFLISGFAILLSTEYVKNAKSFLAGRIKRIYPTFVICSAFTMVCGFVMPDTSKSDLLKRWIESMTFYSDIYGGGCVIQCLLDAPC